MTRLATLGAAAALLAFLVLWLATSCPDGEARKRAEALGDSVAVLLDTLEVHRERTEDLEERLTLERSRAEAIVVQAEAEIERAERRARVARGRVDTLVAAVEGPEGDSLAVALERERAEHRTVVEALETQLEATTNLLAVTDSARAAWRDRAFAAELALEAETARAEAWKAEANPGYLGAIRRNLPMVGATVAATALAVTLVK